LLKYQENKKKNVGNFITEIPLVGGGADDACLPAGRDDG
jgi:hypothetical protein